MGKTITFRTESGAFKFHALDMNEDGLINFEGYNKLVVPELFSFDLVETYNDEVFRESILEKEVNLITE